MRGPVGCLSLHHTLKRCFFLRACLIVAAAFTLSIANPCHSFAWLGTDLIGEWRSVFGSRTSEPRNATPIGTPDAYAGFLIENGQHAWHEMEVQGFPVHGLLHSKHFYPQHGYWLGLSDKIAWNDYSGLLLEGWILVPAESTSRSNYVIEPFVGDVHDTFMRRHWSPKTESFFLDAAFLFSWCPEHFRSGFSQVNGIRYDYYNRKLRNPESVNLPNHGDADQLEVTVNDVILYLGTQLHVQFNCGRGSRGALTLRFLGSPFIIGNLRHQERFGNGSFTDEGTFDFQFGRSYWGETFVSYRHQLTNDLSAGLFLKMTTMSTYGKSDLKTTYASGTTESSQYTLNFRRLTYVVGARLGLAFATPF